MKIYTRTGDEGTTGLIGGNRISKADPRILCLGALDELNATLGVARTFSAGHPLDSWLESIQNRLFEVGAEVATPKESNYYKESINSESILEMESQIDAWNQDLPELTNFVLPGGSSLAAQLHVCRAVCRRAEHHLVENKEVLDFRDDILAFMNRLSDALFTAARFANHSQKAPEVLWKPKQ